MPTIVITAATKMPANVRLQKLITPATTEVTAAMHPNIVGHDLFRIEAAILTRSRSVLVELQFLVNC